MRTTLTTIGLALAAAAQADHSVEHSVPLTLGVQAQAELPAGGSHYYRFDVDGSASVEIRSGGDADTVGFLLDASGTEVATDDDSATGLNFRIVADLEAGPHYVRVDAGGFGGRYGVIARLVREDHHGGSPGTATRLPANVRTAGRIEPPDDRDVFRLDIPATVHATLSTGGPADTAGALATHDGFLLQRSEDGGSGGNFSMERILEPGVYYLSVTAASTSAYNVLLDAPDPRDPPEVHARSLLGYWMANWKWSFGGAASPDDLLLSRTVRLEGVELAVEDAWSEERFLTDTDNSYWFGVALADFDDLGTGDAPFDYLLMNRAYDLFCVSYMYSMRTASASGDDALALFGDWLDDECVFEGASVYRARAFRAFDDLEGYDRPGLSRDEAAELERLAASDPGEPMPAGTAQLVRHALGVQGL